MATFALFGAFIRLMSPTPLHAGAWTEDPGHGQLINTLSAFRTSTAFDASGAAQRFPDNGKFQQFSLSSYLQYGLTRRYTLIVNVAAPFLEYGNLYGSQHSAGLGDVELAIKRRLSSPESLWAVSGQLTVMFPAYSPTRNPPPGNHQEDIETRLLVGRGFDWRRRHGFWDTAVAYRYRSGAPADQARLDLTAGINATHRVMAMAQFFGIRSLRNGEPLSATTNPNAQSDFDAYKCQFSLVIGMGHRTRLQVGWNDAFSGRNTGEGATVLLAVWKSF